MDERCLDTPQPLRTQSRLNQGPQTSTDAYLWALYGYLKEPRDYQDIHMPAYVVNVGSERSNGSRVRILILAKDGRYISLWQPRRRFGSLRLVKVHQRAQPEIYSFLRANLGKPDRACNMVHSLELARDFLVFLGERIEEEEREAG